jgi:glutamate synthase domain-containing protein 3
VVAERINPQLVEVTKPTAARLAHLQTLVERHLGLTGSEVAQAILASWELAWRSFVRVAPREVVVVPAAEPIEEEVAAEPQPAR